MLVLKKLILTALLGCCANLAYAQEVLFIGLYSKPEAGVDYWCRNMDMVKQVVKTVSEAEQLAKSFRLEHSKESPFTKIIRKCELPNSKRSGTS